MTDFGRSAKGPTLTDVSTVASNATQIANLHDNMSDIQDIAAEINDTPSLRTLMDSVVNDTISLAGLTDTTIGTLSQSTNGHVLAYNSSSGNWEVTAPSAGGASEMSDLSDVPANPTNNGHGLKYDTTATNYVPANFAEIGVDYTVPSADNQLAVGNVNGTFAFASTILGDYTFSNNITIGGNLDVTGTTTTINTQDLNVVDATITVAKDATTASQANGAGLAFGNYTGHPTFLYNGTADTLEADRTFVAKGDGSAVAGAVQYNCWTNGHYVTLEGPVHDANGDSYVLRLPKNAPASAGQALTIASTPQAVGGVTTAELEYTKPASSGFAIAMAIVF